MIGETYKNRLFYYKMMKDFIENKISAWELRKQYLSQRNIDLDKDQKNGYTYEAYQKNILNLKSKEKLFKEEYVDLLYEKGSEALKKYEQGSNELDIKGELFFKGIWNFIDCYVIDYYPSDDEGFDPMFNVDEQTLAQRIRVAFDVLERNKERWEYGESENVRNKI